MSPAVAGNNKDTVRFTHLDRIKEKVGLKSMMAVEDLVLSAPTAEVHPGQAAKVFRRPF